MNAEERSHTLELRAASIQMVGVGGAVRQGATERLSLGGSEGHADVVEGTDRVRVEHTLTEHTGHGRVEVAGTVRNEIGGDLTITSAYEDTVLLAGAMTERFDNGAVIAAAMSDDLAVGVGARVTGALDVWLHGVLGLEERAGSVLADGILVEACATLYEREYGPGVHAAAMAVYGGTTVTTMRSGFRPLMRTALGVRNTVPGGGGGATADAPAPPAGGAPSAGGAGPGMLSGGASALGGAAGAGDLEAASDLSRAARGADAAGDGEGAARSASSAADLERLRAFGDEGGSSEDLAALFRDRAAEPYTYPRITVRNGGARVPGPQAYAPATLAGGGASDIAAGVYDIVRFDPEELVASGKFEASMRFTGDAGPSAEEMANPNLIVMIADGTREVRMDPDVYDGIRQGVLELAVFDAHSGEKLSPSDFTLTVPGYATTPDGELRWMGGTEGDVIRLDDPSGHYEHAPVEGHYERGGAAGLGTGRHEIGDAERMGRPPGDLGPPDIVRMIADPHGRVEMDPDIYDGVRQGVLDYAVYDGRTGRRLDPEEYTLAIPGHLPGPDGDLIRVGSGPPPAQRPRAPEGAPAAPEPPLGENYALLGPETESGHYEMGPGGPDLGSGHYETGPAGYEVMVGRRHPYQTLEPTGGYSFIEDIGIVDPDATPTPRSAGDPPPLPGGHPPPRPQADRKAFNAHYKEIADRYLEYRKTLEWRGMMAYWDARNLINEEMAAAFARFGGGADDVPLDEGASTVGMRSGLEAMAEREAEAGNAARADEIMREVARIDGLAADTAEGLRARADEFATIGPPGSQRAPMDPNIDAEALGEWIDAKLADAEARAGSAQEALAADPGDEEALDAFQRASWERDYYTQLARTNQAGVNPLAESGEQIVYLQRTKGGDHRHVQLYLGLQDALIEVLSDPRYHRADDIAPGPEGFDVTKLFPEADAHPSGRAPRVPEGAAGSIEPLDPAQVRFAEAGPAQATPFRGALEGAWVAGDARAPREGPTRFTGSEGTTWTLHPGGGFAPEGTEPALGSGAIPDPPWIAGNETPRETSVELRWDAGVTDPGGGERPHADSAPPEVDTPTPAPDARAEPEAGADPFPEGEWGEDPHEGVREGAGEGGTADAPRAGEGPPAPTPDAAPWAADDFAVERALREGRLPRDFPNRQMARQWKRLAVRLEATAQIGEEAGRIASPKVLEAFEALARGEDPRPGLEAHIETLRHAEGLDGADAARATLEALVGQVDEALEAQHGHRASPEWLETAGRMIDAEDGTAGEEARRAGEALWARLGGGDAPQGPERAPDAGAAPRAGADNAPPGREPRASALYAGGGQDEALEAFEGAPPAARGHTPEPNEIARTLEIDEPEAATADPGAVPAPEEGGAGVREAQAELNAQIDDGAEGRLASDQAKVPEGAGEGQGGTRVEEEGERPTPEVEPDGPDPLAQWSRGNGGGRRVQFGGVEVFEYGPGPIAPRRPQGRQRRGTMARPAGWSIPTGPAFNRAARAPSKAEFPFSLRDSYVQKLMRGEALSDAQVDMLEHVMVHSGAAAGVSAVQYREMKQMITRLRVISQRPSTAGNTEWLLRTLDGDTLGRLLATLGHGPSVA